jgi:DnaJ-class molecular chaperone
MHTIRCAFCKGTGNNPYYKSTCPVCKGKGSNQVVEKYMTCRDCHGSGRKGGTSLTCYTCTGLGVVPDVREELLQARQEIGKVRMLMEEERTQL